MCNFKLVIEWTANLLHWAAPNLVRPRGRTSAPHLWAQLSSIFWTIHYSTPFYLLSPPPPMYLYIVCCTAPMAMQQRGVPSSFSRIALKAWGMGITTKWHQICSAGVRPIFCTEPELNVRLGSVQWKIVRVPELLFYHYHNTMKNGWWFRVHDFLGSRIGISQQHI